MKLIQLIALASIGISQLSLRAQDTFDKMVYCVGTTARAGAEHWAYVLFQPVQLDLLDGKAVAVYQQNGGTGAFQLKSVISGPQTDPSVIKPLLARSERLGQNLAELNGAVNTMFQDLVPDVSVPLEQKVSAIVRGAMGNSEKRKSLFLLARQHSGMALVMGQAAALKLPAAGSYTFEVRNRGAAASAATPSGDEGVLGRVTVNTAAPLVLPAPGKPFHVADATPRGNLHAQLRWPTPNALREVSLSQYGFNLYRMTPAHVTSRNYNVTPPTRAQLTADLAGGLAIRVNHLPVLADRDYDAVTVADPGNKSFFIADDNRQFEGGTPFADGSSYWYFVTARDILGVDGNVSPGLMVTMCDRVAPTPPTDLEVTNESALTVNSTAPRQWLRVKWKSPEANDASGLLKYYVYRWTNIDQIASNQRTSPAAPNPNLIATVNHVAGTSEYFVDDLNLAGSPVQPANNGVSFWYTVRAVDNSSCQNVSGNSAPEFGVLRDRQGPPAPQGSVAINCHRPVATFRNATITTDAAADQNPVQIHANILAEAVSPGISENDSAEFYRGSTLIGQVPFRMEDGATALRARLLYDQPAGLSSIREITCRVRTATGLVSAIAYSTGSYSPANNATQTVNFTFDASVAEITYAAGTGNECGDKHDPVDPATGEMNLPTVTFIPPAASREYKVYRRIDNGPLSMIKQGTYPAGSAAPMEIPDDNIPALPGSICYYLQCFDEHGNASPMSLLGCIENCGKLPAPMLAGLEGTGNSAAPKVRVKWFCPPAGVTRFEILLHRTSGSYNLAGAGLSTDKAQHPNIINFDGGAEKFDFAIFETASLQSQATLSAEHSVELPCSIGDIHRVMVRAVGPGLYGSRCTGPLSNGEQFSWTGSAASNPIDVPWPARPLPAQDNAFAAGLTTHWLNNGLRTSLGAGVRIGYYTISDRGWEFPPLLGANGEIQQTVMKTNSTPPAALYKNSEAAQNETGKYAGTLLPYALFRYQVPNAKFPTVSGDVSQVSPLMEEIAYQTGTFTAGSTTSPAHILKDPFIAGIPQASIPSNGDTMGAYLYALDRQPVVRGAEYKYLFVRFKGRTKEIDRIVPAAGSVTIP